ncbi:hypothetical protein GCM10009864_50780 [Streptomyces lunalinharesii]|uniref:Uncharacterized protein n=1 Tax=Streptomyces lunalinharesii TaxID=333384 RepID=A0ABN3SCN4_9ACTN
MQEQPVALGTQADDPRRRQAARVPGQGREVRGGWLPHAGTERGQAEVGPTVARTMRTAVHVFRLLPAGARGGAVRLGKERTGLPGRFTPTRQSFGTARRNPRYGEATWGHPLGRGDLS